MPLFPGFCSFGVEVQGLQQSLSFTDLPYHTLSSHSVNSSLFCKERRLRVLKNHTEGETKIFSVKIRGEGVNPYWRGNKHCFHS